MIEHKGLVYLAGPMTGMKGGINDYTIEWRREATNFLKEFSIKTISPTRNCEDVFNSSFIRSSYEQTNHANSKAVGLNNLHDVQRCDLLLANFLESEDLSIGTSCEIGMAFALRKPVILVCSKVSLYARHPTINILSYGPYYTLNEGLEMVLHVL